MSLIQRTVCMVLNHQFGEFRKIRRQWRKRRECARCGYVDIQHLTPLERKTYEEREARDLRAKRRKATERQREKNSGAATHTQQSSSVAPVSPITRAGDASSPPDGPAAA